MVNYQRDNVFTINKIMIKFEDYTYDLVFIIYIFFIFRLVIEIKYLNDYLDEVYDSYLC